MSLEMQALANALNQWGQPKVLGHASEGDVDVIVIGEVRNYCLVIGEPAVFVIEQLVHV